MNCSTEVLCVVWYIIIVQNACVTVDGFFLLLQVVIAIMSSYSLVRACGPIDCEIKLMNLCLGNRLPPASWYLVLPCGSVKSGSGTRMLALGQMATWVRLVASGWTTPAVSQLADDRKFAAPEHTSHKLRYTRTHTGPEQVQSYPVLS